VETSVGHIGARTVLSHEKQARAGDCRIRSESRTVERSGRLGDTGGLRPRTRRGLAMCTYAAAEQRYDCRRAHSSYRGARNSRPRRGEPKESSARRGIRGALTGPHTRATTRPIPVARERRASAKPGRDPQSAVRSMLVSRAVDLHCWNDTPRRARTRGPPGRGLWLVQGTDADAVKRGAREPLGIAVPRK